MEIEKLSRRERDKLRQRGEILAAALDLFSERGFHNVSMHEIAKKAEFAIGTLYKFFNNKQDLYKALVLEECDIFHDALVQSLDTPVDEIEKIRIFVRAKEELFWNNLPFIRLYFAEGRGVSYTFKAGLEEALRKRYCDFLDKLAAVFKSGIENGLFQPIADPYYLAVALDSTANAFHRLWLHTPERGSKPEDSETILNIFFQGLLKSSDQG